LALKIFENRSWLTLTRGEFRFWDHATAGMHL